MLPEGIIDQIRLKFKHQLPEEFLEELQKNALLIELKKGEILFSDQAKRNRVFVIIDGSLVRFIVTPEGANRATMFHTEALFPMIGNNFENVEGSNLSYYIKANENAKLIEFKRDFALHCIEKYPFLAKTSFMNMIDYFQTHHIIQNHLIALSSIDFFQWFLMQYGFIFKRFQSQDIASFMGITPEWFSKLKRKANK
ncbi:CRP-like cAMP-binding protein [Sphingobacterium sp. JUb20]|nr:CRP-like cAMP-binding protein [Sphingobacterium sp. JUb20]